MCCSKSHDLLTPPPPERRYPMRREGRQEAWCRTQDAATGGCGYCAHSFLCLSLEWKDSIPVTLMNFHVLGYMVHSSVTKLLKCHCFNVDMRDQPHSQCLPPGLIPSLAPSVSPPVLFTASLPASFPVCFHCF